MKEHIDVLVAEANKHTHHEEDTKVNEAFAAVVLSVFDRLDRITVALEKLAAVATEEVAD